MVPFTKSADGFESQFGINHLDHFALARLLIDPLLHSQALRVANIGSDAHRFGRMNIDRIVGENGNVHSPSRAYARSKLANLLFTYESQRQLDARRLHTLALAAHPDISFTNLGQHLEKRWTSKRTRPLSRLWMQSAAMGAMPALRAAVDPDVSSGEYFGLDSLFGFRSSPIVVSCSWAARNDALAQDLWRFRKT